MDQFGQNQFAPGMKSALFVPDQLIAGTLQLVTDTGIITGGAYKRGLCWAWSPPAANTQKCENGNRWQ
jgi:hypothetical protein